MAVFTQTLKEGRRTLFVLSVAIAAFCALLASLYPSFHQQATLALKFMPSFVRAMVANVPLDRPEGYSAWGFSHPIWIALASAWPIATAGGAVAGGIERGTLGLVLSAPVSRGRYLLARAGAMIAGEGIVLGSAHVAMLVGYYVVGYPPAGGPAAVGLLFLQTWLVYSTLGLLALAVSALTSESGPAYGAGIGLAIFCAVVTLVSSMWPQWSGLRYLSLFSYLHPFDLLRGAAVPASAWLVPAGIAVAAFAMAMVAFRRRDLAI